MSLQYDTLQDMGIIWWQLRWTNSSPQINIYQHLKTRLKQIFLVLALQWFKLFGMVIFNFVSKKWFFDKKRSKTIFNHTWNTWQIFFFVHKLWQCFNYMFSATLKHTIKTKQFTRQNWRKECLVRFCNFSSEIPFYF